MTGSAIKTFDSTYQDAFLNRFIELGYIKQAIEAVGFTEQTVYYHLERNEEFAKRFEKAKEEALKRLLSRMEVEADRRGMDGVDHPVIHQGKILDTYKKYSDNLLMFRMKRLDPAYKDGASMAITLNQANVALDSGGLVSAIVDQLEQATTPREIDISPGYEDTDEA